MAMGEAETMQGNMAPEAAWDEETLWQNLIARQGQVFHTAKNLEFTYTIRGGEIFVDRRSKSITRATISKAFGRVKEDAEHQIRGPKALNCFGAPYVWAIFTELGIVAPSEPGRRGRPRKDISAQESIHDENETERSVKL